MNEIKQWRLGVDEMHAEMGRILADVIDHKPDALLVLARVGNDLMIRGAGTPLDMLKLYADTPEEILRMVRAIESEEAMMAKEKLQ